MISVIIPTYKSPIALDLCLKSAIEGQTLQNEIIVVVDGFYEINEKVIDKYKHDIQVLDLEENVGLCRATNLGVYNAKFDKVLIVNDDNVFPKDWDIKLLEHYEPNTVLTPNQIEPIPSMFKQFTIKDLGRIPEHFNLLHFQKYVSTVSYPKKEETGSTLPIFISKMDYLRVGGWDENYQLGMVADWDFFLKCSLSGMKMVRSYNCHFYHFVSLTTLSQGVMKERQTSENSGHAYARYKWGTYIQHNPTNNLKYLNINGKR